MRVGNRELGTLSQGQFMDPDTTDSFAEYASGYDVNPGITRIRS